MSVPRPHGSGSTDRITVPCGKCVACLSKERAYWSFRLSQELKVSRTAFFVTLTYDDEHVNKSSQGKAEVSVRDVQLFIKALRQESEKVSEMAQKGPKIKYYITAEYGPQTLRPHYHGIIFNLPIDSDNCEYKSTSDIILKCWKRGQIKVGSVNGASINYVTKYCITRKDKIEGCANPFSLMSKGLGISYIETAKKYHTENQFFFSVVEGGNKVALPRYYKDKIFSDYEKNINNIKSTIRNDREIEKNWKSGLYELEQKKQLTDIVNKKIKKNSKL